MRSSSRTIAWVVGGVWLFASAGAAANPLETELLTLINDHPDIRSAAKSYASAREGISVSRSDYFPTVKVNGDYGPTMIDTVGQKSISRHQKTAGVTITENLFDGFATTSGVEIAKLNAEVAELTLEGARQNTMLEGIRAYIDVLRQQRLIELSKNNEANIQAQLNLEDERVQRGAGVAVDVLQAKSRLQIAKERRVSFEGALEQAVARYIQVFNHAPDLEKMFDPQPPVDIIPPDLETAINHALGHNPAVANGAANVEVARVEPDAGAFAALSERRPGRFVERRAGPQRFRRHAARLFAAAEGDHGPVSRRQAFGRGTQGGLRLRLQPRHRGNGPAQGRLADQDRLEPVDDHPTARGTAGKRRQHRLRSVQRPTPSCARRARKP